jgi:CubicO group peptidase (beta-lactamase class C family)
MVPNYFMASNTITGAIVGVKTSDGQYFKAFGNDRTAATSLTTDHKMRYGSISKMWCSLLILNRIKDGYLSLNDTLDMFPNLGTIPNMDRITIRMLLLMRSGLKDYLQQDAVVQQQYFLTPTATFDTMNYIRTTPPLYEPDTVTSYCNSNWVLMGRILEWVDQNHLHPDAPRDYRTIILEDSVTALGLSSVEWPAGNYMTAPYSRGWATNMALPVVKSTLGPLFGLFGWLAPVVMPGVQLTEEIEFTACSTSWPDAAGSLDGDIFDLVKFGEAVFSGELINPELEELRREVFATYLTYTPTAPWQGPGWMGVGLGFISWGDWWGWIGNLAGYKATMFVNHLTGTVIAIMMCHDTTVEDINCFYQIAYLLDPESTQTIPDQKVRLDAATATAQFGPMQVLRYEPPGDEDGHTSVPLKVPFYL